MKTKLTKLLVCLMALALAFGAAACKLTDEKTPVATNGSASAQTDVDNDAVAISIGDKYTVTRGEIADMYDSMVTQYSYFGMAEPTADADIESLQDMVAEMLASENVQRYQAELMGITLDEKAMADVEAKVEEEMAGYMESFRAQAVSEGAADPDARATEIFGEQLAAAGLDMDVEGYRAFVKEQLSKEELLGALEAKVKSEVTATAEEAQTYYDDLLAAQKESYAEHPENYLEDQESYEKFGGDPVLVTPDGYVRVRTIKIVPQGELGEEYTTVSDEMAALEAEYGKLMLTAAATSTARLAEIKTAYAEKKAKADELYDAYMADAQTKAAEAAAALKEGKAFEEVMQTYNDDEVYTTYPSFVNTGLLMQKGVVSSTWTDALVKAVDLLKDGGVSPMIEGDDGFYFVQLVGEEPAGEAPFGDVEEEMTRLAAESAAQQLWDEKQEEWLGDPSLVQYHEEVYRSVGKK